LQARGLVYPCFCTRKELRMLASAPHIGDEGVPYPGTCRSLSETERTERMAQGKRFSLRLDTQAAMRAALSGTAETEHSLLSFEDAVLGPQAFTMKDCGGDFALRRSDGVFAYQLAVTVDDAAMGVTEVVRGEDLLLSTPRQILLLRLLGASAPRYAHVPLLHDSEGERLAKRHKSLELKVLREAGIGPEAVIGYLGHLAGFLDTLRPITARELLPLFSFRKLAGKRLVVHEDAFPLP
jgi:glutamyl-tRNA synthetase